MPSWSTRHAVGAMLTFFTSALAASDAQHGALLPAAGASPHVDALHAVLGKRCPSATKPAELLRCRRAELSGAMRRLTSLKPLTDELDEALAAALSDHRQRVGATELHPGNGTAFRGRAVSMVAPQFGTYSESMSPELQCRCNQTLYGQASERIWSAAADGTCASIGIVDIDKEVDIARWQRLERAT